MVDVNCRKGYPPPPTPPPPLTPPSSSLLSTFEENKCLLAQIFANLLVSSLLDVSRVMPGRHELHFHLTLKKFPPPLFLSRSSVVRNCDVPLR